jgi:hypothetical protein
MKKRKIYLTLLGFLLIINCSYDNPESQMKADVIAFHPEKCMCCWGWDIKIGDKIIRTDSGIVGSVVGYEIEKPVPVLIVLGEKEEDCSTYYAGLEFYEIADIELIK